MNNNDTSLLFILDAEMNYLFEFAEDSSNVKAFCLAIVCSILLVLLSEDISSEYVDLCRDNHSINS